MPLLLVHISVLSVLAFQNLGANQIERNTITRYSSFCASLRFPNYTMRSPLMVCEEKYTGTVWKVNCIVRIIQVTLKYVARRCARFLKDFRKVCFSNSKSFALNYNATSWRISSAYGNFSANTGKTPAAASWETRAWSLQSRQIPDNWT